LNVDLKYWRKENLIKKKRNKNSYFFGHERKIDGNKRNGKLLFRKACLSSEKMGEIRFKQLNSQYYF
jgi:hypothetical protein